MSITRALDLEQKDLDELRGLTLPNGTFQRTLDLLQEHLKIRHKPGCEARLKHLAVDVFLLTYVMRLRDSDGNLIAWMLYTWGSGDVPWGWHIGVFVAPAHRRKGRGTKLVKTARKVVTLFGHRLVAQVHDELSAAFYRKLGFQVPEKITSTMTTVFWEPPPKESMSSSKCDDIS